MALRFDIASGTFIDDDGKKVDAMNASQFALIPMMLKGDKGDKGDTPTDDDIRPLVVEEVSKIPIPKDGESIDPADVLRMVMEEVDKIPKPKDGTSITLEDVRPLVAEAISSIKVESGKDGVGIASILGENGGLSVTLTDGTSQTFTLPAGREIELQANQTHILWRYKGESWQQLFAIPKARRSTSGGGGIHNILDAYDVSAQEISDGETLVWDATTNKFIAGSGGGGGGVTTLNGLAGALSITSTGATITVTPSGSTINLEAAGSAPTFNLIGSGTNTTAAMVVGTGASLAASGSGTITATAVPASGLTGATLAAGVTASSLTSVGTIVTGVWNGTDIAVADGGTGSSTAAGARTNLAVGEASGWAKLTVGTSTPATPATGDLWVDTN